MDSEEFDKVTEVLTNLERVAEEILTDRQAVIDMDRKRNKNREGIRHLMKTTDKKTWIAMGNTFFKFETGAVKGMLEKDQEKLDKEINSTRDGLKVKMNKLRDLEGKSALKGYDLKPLNKDEADAIHQVFRRS